MLFRPNTTFEITSTLYGTSDIGQFYSDIDNISMVELTAATAQGPPTAAASLGSIQRRRTSLTGGLLPELSFPDCDPDTGVVIVEVPRKWVHPFLSTCANLTELAVDDLHTYEDQGQRQIARVRMVPTLLDGDAPMLPSPREVVSALDLKALDLNDIAMVRSGSYDFSTGGTPWWVPSPESGDNLGPLSPGSPAGHRLLTPVAPAGRRRPLAHLSPLSAELSLSFTVKSPRHGTASGKEVQSPWSGKPPLSPGLGPAPEGRRTPPPLSLPATPPTDGGSSTPLSPQSSKSPQGAVQDLAKMVKPRL